MMLMRKGPTLQWCWYTYDLADWLFKDLDDEALLAAAAAQMSQA